MKESSLEQERAQRALAAIDTLKSEAYGKYVSYVKGLPAAILQNGLGQALATLLAGARLSKEPDRRGQDEKDRERLYLQLRDWLCRNDEQAPYYGEEDLMKAITTHDENTYIRAQAEALAYLTWLKKFAVAYLKQR